MSLLDFGQLTNAGWFLGFTRVSRHGAEFATTALHYVLCFSGVRELHTLPGFLALLGGDVLRVISIRP